MKRVVAVLVAALVVLPNLANTQRVAAAPPTIPTGSEEARLWGYIDGDKFDVRIGDETHELNTIGADAPETDKGDLGECYAKEAGSRIRKLVPKKATIWLEKDEKDKDGKDRLLRYVWVSGDDGTVFMLNERLVQEGYASFVSKDDNTRYDDRLKKAQDAAKKGKKGLWGTCGGPHEELKPEPKLGDADKPATIGATLKTDGQEITVSDAFFTNDYGFSTPKGGYVFLVFTATIKNVDKPGKDHGYDEERFSARDLDSDATFDNTYTLADQPLSGGDLSPSEYAFGTVVLEVQETVSRVRIKYDPKTFGDGDEVYWIVGR